MTWGPENILIQNNLVKKNANVGIYFDDHTHNSFIKGNDIVGNNGTGIYLEYHSSQNTVEENKIFKNGYYYSESTKQMTRSREGIAIDSSVKNTIVNNAFWDNGKGGIFLYKNCGESGAAPNTTGVPTRELGSDDNIINKNRFYREQTGVWVASRQDAPLTRQRCNDPTPYSETDYFVNDKGETEGPYHIYFLDFAERNTISENQFIDNAIGVKIADDDNITTGNIFRGSTAINVEIGLSRRFSVVKDPVKNITVSNSASLVTPVPEFALYNFINHPENFTFSNNRQIVDTLVKKTCDPIIKSVPASNHPKLTCTFYFSEGSLAEGEISKFRDLTPESVVGDTYGSAEYKCVNGSWVEISKHVYINNSQSHKWVLF